MTMTSSQVIRSISSSASRQEVVLPSKLYRIVSPCGILLGRNLPSSFHHLAFIYELYDISLKSATPVIMSATSVIMSATSVIMSATSV